MPTSFSTQTAEILNRIRTCAAAVTRYPLELLTADASLEDELGVDSVKRAEIAAVVGREFGLPPTLLASAEVRSLGVAAEMVQKALSSSAPAPVVKLAPVSEPPRAVAKDLEGRVRAVFARVTRYPEELLTPAAALEDELGIDSVKVAEALAVLDRELGLSPPSVRTRRLRTLSEVCEDAKARLGGQAAGPGPLIEPVATPRPPESPETPFRGKVALVTGSGKGIGKVIATRLARSGATVVVNSFHSRDEGERTTQEILAAGGKAVHLWGSVARADHLDRIFAAVEQEFGGLDFLVCNASNGAIGPFDRLTTDDWEKAFRTCVIGTYESAMRARRLMARRGGGSIVTLSTCLSQRYMRDLGCQGIVKAAVESLTRYLATELAPDGIRVNCLSPGFVYGDLLNKFPDAAARISRWEAATPGAQLCTADDVADVAELLLGPKTTRVNGAIWVVDGGLSATVDGLLPSAASRSGSSTDVPPRLASGL
jgi:NAD(P)-dependent dehydrogenase (short-subunit alcohol dehydrogenase family)/acyl carrier protein